MLGAKPVGGLLSESGELLYDRSTYKNSVGKLIYLTVTWPNISYVMSVESLLT